MSCQHANPVRQQRVPNVAVEVVVSREEKSPARTEADRGDAADYGLVIVRLELLVGADVEEPAGSVVTSGSECKTVGEEGDCVYVTLVTGECLRAHTVPYVPHFSTGIARS